MAGFNEGGHAIHARDAERAPASWHGKNCSAQGLTKAGGALDNIRRVAGSPGRRVAGSPGRRVAGSPGRRVAGRDSCAFIVAPPRAIRLPA